MKNEIAKLEQLARDPETPRPVREAALAAALSLLRLVIATERVERGIVL